MLLLVEVLLITAALAVVLLAIPAVMLLRGRRGKRSGRGVRSGQSDRTLLDSGDLGTEKPADKTRSVVGRDIDRVVDRSASRVESVVDSGAPIIAAEEVVDRSASRVESVVDSGTPAIAAEEVVDRSASRVESVSESLGVSESESSSRGEPEPRPSLRERLGKARAAFVGSLAQIRQRSSMSEDTWDELAEALIRADVGVTVAFELTEATRARIASGSSGAVTPEDALEELRAEIRDRLRGDRRLAFRSDDGAPAVWLFLGVNGRG